jgi:hypothetical protein
LTASQINGWLDYNDIEPFGELRSELRHGQAMALTANINRDEKKKGKPYNATDFMNFYEAPEEPEERKLSVEELETYAKQVFGA